MEEPYNLYSLLLDRTARSVKQYAQRRFKDMGFNITVDQWLILRHLDTDKPLNQKDLAEMLYKDTPTLTRIIDLLCGKGLAERRVQPGDRRCFQVHLTPAGKALVDELRPKIKEVRLKAWEGLSQEDFEHFKRILHSINTNLEGIKAEA